MKVPDKNLVIFVDNYIRTFERDEFVLNRSDLKTKKLDPSFEGFEDFIVECCFLVANSFH